MTKPVDLNIVASNKLICITCFSVYDAIPDQVVGCTKCGFDDLAVVSEIVADSIYGYVLANIKEKQSLRQKLEAAQKELAEQEGYEGIAHDFEECKRKLAQSEADARRYRALRVVGVFFNPDDFKYVGDTLDAEADNHVLRLENISAQLSGAATAAEGAGEEL